MKERIDEKTILKYLPGLSRDICERSGISRQHTNICLKRLVDQNLVEIEKIVKVRGTPAPYYRLKKNECTNIILSLFGSGEEMECYRTDGRNDARKGNSLSVQSNRFPAKKRSK